jgi:hypothetical protein
MLTFSIYQNSEKKVDQKLPFPTQNKKPGHFFSCPSQQKFQIMFQGLDA